MVELIGDRTKEIVLAHLSEEANSEKALKNMKIFNEYNLDFNNIKVASRLMLLVGEL
ncbi:MAG: hypothetical protein ACLRQF_12100 [Thomasclavelia ramosa]